MADQLTTVYGLTKPDAGSTGWDVKLNSNFDLIDEAIADLDAEATTSGALKLPLAGGTMSGAIAMGSQKITGLAAATANGDALRYEQLPAALVAGQIVGTATNDSASAGNIGQYIESVAGAVSATGNGQRFNITSITLTAGDWDISALIVFNKNSAVTTYAQGGIGTASGDNETGYVAGSNSSYSIAPTDNNGPTTLAIPSWRVSIAGSTTYYLKAYFAYSSGTPTANGRISARRKR